jgi:hypothetical protein
MNNNPHWITCIDQKRRFNLLCILEELSSLLNREEPDFVIIGAMALLIQGFIGGYKVLWDVDLLFKDAESIEAFRKAEKSPHARIVELDDEIVKNKQIGSLHSVWSFNKTWFNVDYIIKDDLYEFYNPKEQRKEPHREKVEYENREYPIELYLAHPLDIFTEKMVSPRMEKELETSNDFGVDIRHCFYMLQKFGNEEWFWQGIKKSAGKIGKESQLQKHLAILMSTKDQLGYGDVELPLDVMDRVKNLREE